MEKDDKKERQKLKKKKGERKQAELWNGLQSFNHKVEQWYSKFHT